ncbi:MAG: hypothetical protein V4709_09870 [Pseudomonadota bacterium]
MRLIKLVPAASVFAVSAAVVSTVALAPPQYSQASQRALGLACPAGYRQVDAMQFALEYRPGMSEAAKADLKEKYPNPVCIAQKSPESLSEFTKAQAAKVEARGAQRPGALREAVQQKNQMQALQSKVDNADATWLPYGNGVMIGDGEDFPEVNGQGFSNLAGRADQFAYDAINQRLFVAIGNGGIWMSTAPLGDISQIGTAAAPWVSVGDKLPTQVTSGVGWTTGGGGTLIALTGEHSQGGNTYIGLGAYWSNDLGATWNAASGVPDGALGFHVETDPSNPLVVYLATGKGLFRSADAGRSYTNVALPVTAECAGVDGVNKKFPGTTTPDGMGPCVLANIVTDVTVKHPGGTTSETGGQVLAAVGFRGGNALFLDGTPQSPGNGLYRSDTGAPGTFTKLDVSGTGSTAMGFTPQDRIGRIEFGVATGPAQNHNYVYAMVQDSILLNGGLAVPFGLPGVDDVVAALSELDCSMLPEGDPQFVCETLQGGAVLGATTINGIYVSPDFGTTWTRMADTTELALLPVTGSSLIVPAALGVGPGVQAWYDLWMAVDPTRVSTVPAGVPTRIGFGMEEVWQNRTPAIPQNGTLQSGLTDFAVIGPYFSGDRCQLLIGSATPGIPVCVTDTNPVDLDERVTTHPDQQAGIYIPTADGGVCLFAGGDGGVFTQCVGANEEMDNTKWTDSSNIGFHTLFHYGIAVAKDGTVWFGNQDNGSGKITPTGETFQTYVGDGVYAAVDPDDSNIAYVETPGLNLQLTTDGGTTYTSIAPPATNPYFGSMFIMDPTDKNHLIAGGTEIFETVLGSATTADTWVQVFNLGSGPDGAIRNLRATDTHGKYSYVAFCGPCSPLVAAGFQRGIATNAGAADADKASPNGWHFAAANGLPNRYITWIEIDPADATGKTIYVTLAGYSLAKWIPPGMFLDDEARRAAAMVGAGNLWKSTDGGESFTNFSGNLANSEAYFTTVYKRGSQVLLGTEIGAFIADVPAAGAAPVWAPMGKGLPNVVVAQFQTQPGKDNQLFVGTFGRGTWTYPLKAVTVTPPGSPPVITPAPPANGGGLEGGRFGGGSLGLAALSLLALAGLRRRRLH